MNAPIEAAEAGKLTEDERIDSLLERHQGAMTKDQFMAAGDEIRALIAEAEADERALIHARIVELAKWYGHPNGTQYEQGCQDMARRISDFTKQRSQPWVGVDE